MNTCQPQARNSTLGMPLAHRQRAGDKGASASFRVLGAWLPLIALPALAVAVRAALPPWAFMWSILFAIVGGCKWMTAWRAVSRSQWPGFGRLLGYLLAWPGMDAETFFDRTTQVHRPAWSDWTATILKIAIGAALVCVLARITPADQPLLAGWIGMIGLAFVLHFGVFHLLALAWQSAGVDAPHIFRSPLLASSVGDLWGSRWNLAFRDLAHTLIFRPLVDRVGVGGASFATFAVSGLVHELVISLPAGAGYGLPTLYFLIQWLGVVVERSGLGRRIGLRRGLTGWLFAFVVVAGPACLLFHPPFLTGVMVPFLEALGAY